jgi:hypothetical protein
MKNILLVNHKKLQCGIFQYGENLSFLLSRDNTNKYFYLETNIDQDLFNFLEKNQIDVILFNWYSATMSWVNDYVMSKLNNYKNYFIFHDHSLPNFSNITGILYNDPTKNVNNINEFNIERFLFKIKPQNKLNDKIVISSFGFGFQDKGFQKIIELVNNEFENVIIRLHIPTAMSVDSNDYLKNKTIQECLNKQNEKNELIITHHYMDNEQLLNWLSESTLNCFLYDDKPSLGISSCIDYALSVDVPIAITECSMFRHILNDNILIKNKSLNEIIKNGLKELDSYKNKWSEENFIKRINKILN